MVFHAVRITTTAYDDLAPYDVPEVWDGTSGADWGFLSDLSKTAIPWNEGVFNPGFTAYLGWGISQNNGETFVGTWSSLWDFSYVPVGGGANALSQADGLSNALIAEAPLPGALPLALGALGAVRGRRRA